MTGRMLDETLGKWHFWLFVIGFHLTFDSMHIPGLLGMPRRIYTYEPGRGWEIWNLIVSVGVIFQIAGILFWVSTLSGRTSRARWRATIPGMRGRWSGPPLLRRRIQLRRNSGGCQPPSAVGPEASGRSRLEVRIEENLVLARSIHCAARKPEMPLSPELRGRVGMWCLIAAESAIFSIFVVAYLVLRGQEPQRPDAGAKFCMCRFSTRSVCSPAASRL